MVQIFSYNMNNGRSEVQLFHDGVIHSGHD